MTGTIKTLTDRGFGFISRDGETKSLKSYREAVQKQDPYGIFSNPTGDILGIKWPKRGEDFSGLHSQ